MLRVTWWRTACVCAALMICGAHVARAQEPDLRPRDQVEVIDQQLREETEERLRPAEEEPPPITEAEPEEFPSPTSETRFFVRRIELAGNTVIAREDLAHFIAAYENRDVSLAELGQLAQALTQYYRQRGFVTSQAIIPAQDVVNQTLTIRIIEGKVGELRVEGNRVFSTRQIVSYARVRSGEVLRYSRLRADLLRMNQHPDREVQTILQRGDLPETTNVILRVTERRPVHVGGSLDNKGGQSIGRYRVGLNARHTNLFGHDDTWVTGTMFGRDFGAAYAQYRMPIPRTDTTLLAGVNHAQVSPKKGLKAFGVNGISQTYFGRVEQMLLDTERVNVTMHLGMDVKDSRTQVLSGTFRRERLRVLRVGPTLQETDRFGRTHWSHDLSWGINGFGAAIHEDPTSSRRGVQPSFLVYSSELTRRQRMPWRSQLVLKGEYQFASRKLPSSEGLYLGGASSVRGYPESDYTADYGFLTSAEYLLPAFFIPSRWTIPAVKTKPALRDRIELASFIDLGYGWLKGPSISEVGKRHLIGIGAGVRVHLYEQLYARVDWAHALGQAPLSEAARSRFHFAFQYDF